MKSFVRVSALFLLLAPLSQNTLAETLPEYRPALLGQDRRSLINLISAETLMKRGQRDAIVMFSCGISEQGRGFFSRCYRGTPNSDLLRQEVLGRIDQAQFEPAAQAAGPIRDALFVPGFRNGKATPCRFTWSLIFTGPGRQMGTG